MKTTLIALVAFIVATSVLASEPLANAARVRVTFDARRIIDVRASGLADRAAGRAATADDPARIASISKMFVAMGVLRLVEAGRLDLDRDVSTWRGWSLRNPAFPDQAVTLRRSRTNRA